MDPRDRILALVRDFPGLHLRELARQADTSLNLVQYHVQHLENEGFVDVALDGGKVRVFPPDLRKEDRGILGCLRDKKRLRIAMVLLSDGPMSHSAIVSEVKMGKSTLSFHLRNMEAVGLIENQDSGYGVADPKRVRALLDRYRPTPDAADRLADVWDKVYGKR